MFDLRLTDEQLAMREVVRDFVNREIKPVANQLDQEPDFTRRFPLEILRKLSQMGLRTTSMSLERGGSDLDALTGCLIGEELGAGDLGIAVTVGQTAALAHNYFDVVMNAQQRERFLPQFLADDDFHLALALHEPDTDLGFDYYVADTPTYGDRTVATQRSDGSWVINGEKNFQTNGTVAKLLAVRARTEWGAAAFLVPAETPGLTSKQIDCTGRRLAGWANLYFEDCVIPDVNRLGAVGERPKVGLGMASASRIAASVLGVGRTAYEAAIAYATMRVQGRKPIVQHQTVGVALAEMSIKLDAARALIWQSAWLADQLKAGDAAALQRCAVSATHFSAMSRGAAINAIQTAFDVVCRASTLFGGAGAMRETPMQKYIRDVSVYLQAAPRDVNLLRIAEALTGFVRGPNPFSEA